MADLCRYRNTNNSFIRVLSLAVKQDITRRDTTDVMADQLGLTDEERNARIFSGNMTYISNRTGWANRKGDEGYTPGDSVWPRVLRGASNGNSYRSHCESRDT